MHLLMPADEQDSNCPTIITTTNHNNNSDIYVVTFSVPRMIRHCAENKNVAMMIPVIGMPQLVVIGADYKINDLYRHIEVELPPEIEQRLRENLRKNRKSHDNVVCLDTKNNFSMSLFTAGLVFGGALTLLSIYYRGKCNVIATTKYNFLSTTLFAQICLTVQ